MLHYKDLKLKYVQVLNIMPGACFLVQTISHWEETRVVKNTLLCSTPYLFECLA